MSDIPINKAFLDELIKAESVRTYSSITSNAMPDMPRCSVLQYVTMYRPAFCPNLIRTKHVYRVPGVYLKFTRDILESICARLGQNVSKGSLNPERIWIEDGSCRIPPANNEMPHYREGFLRLMKFMFGHLKDCGDVELNDFFTCILQLTDLDSFRYLLLHPFLQTEEQRYVYPVMAMHLMHTLGKWRQKYISQMRSCAKGGCLNFCHIAQHPLFGKVMESRKQTKPHNPTYSSSIDGVVEFVRNVYTHCNDPPQSINDPWLITQMKDAELEVAHHYPYNNLNLYNFFRFMSMGEKTNFFGSFTKKSGYGDLMACRELKVNLD